LRRSAKNKALLQHEQPKAAARVTKHKLCATPTYHAWVNMKQVCTNPNNPGYSNYGARGIRVCDEWLESFEAFHADIGDRPNSSMWLVRINKAGDYEPTKLQWEVRPRRYRGRRWVVDIRSST
jgi:hypothetical protein